MDTALLPRNPQELYKDRTKQLMLSRGLDLLYNLQQPHSVGILERDGERGGENKRTEGLREVDSASSASFPWPELTVAELHCPPEPRHRDTSIDSRLPVSLQATVTMPISSRPTQSRATTARSRIPHSTTMRGVSSLVGHGSCPSVQTQHRQSSSNTTLLELAGSAGLQRVSVKSSV